MPLTPGKGLGPYRKPLKKKDILAAQALTISNNAAAKLMGVSFTTYKKYAKIYGIFDSHMNRGGRGTIKPRLGGEFGLQEIFDGKHPHYPLTRLKERLLKSGMLPCKCSLCGFDQSRADGKYPFVLVQLDGNKTNFAIDNLSVRCYNCVYITTGYIRLPVEEPEVDNIQVEEDMINAGGLTEEEMIKLREQLQKET